jgi:uncharacterized protein (TIGR02466 family)
MQAYEYFPSIIYRDERPEWAEYLKQSVQKHYEWAENNRPVDQKDWPVSQTAMMAEDPDLKFLCDYLLIASREILRNQGYATDRYEFYISGLWGQDIKCHGATNMHIHKNSQICGWFFLETPEGGSYPIYEDPRLMSKRMVELDYEQGVDIVNATSYVHFNNVVPGTVLFANSWLAHQLAPSAAKNQTKTIHFIVSHKDKEPVCSMS